ncbi:MAG: HD domain-containing protein [Bacteroidota bacterium]|nr:CCA tRNA nucleotidyltransferase [Candidatus Kapabacteria bacterium]MDW8220906.1 HD domain-containing protein [Bacteroidota bacterium]
MRIPLDDAVLQTVGTFADELGVEIYVVGGYVRDVLRSATRKDIDFTLVGDAVRFAQRLAQRMGSHAVVYERFRTALVPIRTSEGLYHCEFVGTRREEYMPHSRKPIVKEGTLEEDLRRRDFTVNAMAVCLNQHRWGQLVDMFGGQRDMAEQILRTPLDPFTTFSDDPLRMMRAARFAAQLGFRVEETALAAMQAMAERISIISQERITDELLKILAAPKPSIGIDLLFKTGLLRYVFPELHELAGVELVHVEGHAYRHKDVLYHTLQVVDNVAAVSDNLWLRFATLMHDIAKPKTKRFITGVGWSFHGHEELGARWQDRIFRKLKLPLQHLKYVKTLVRLHQRPMALVDDEVTDSAIRRLIVQAEEAGDTALNDLFILCRADITTKNPKRAETYLQNYDLVYQKTLVVRERDKLMAFQSPLRGEDIMRLCNLEPSRAVGVLKTAIETAILDGVIPNDADAARAYLLEHKDTLLTQLNAPSNRRSDVERRLAQQREAARITKKS